MGYIGNQSAGITYTNINTFRGKVANLTALNAVSGMENGDLYLTENNNHAHMYTGTVWVDLGEIRGPQGPVGPRGIAGASVSTVVRTTGDGSAGTTDVYTITYNDATTSTFTVYNGEDGVPGIIDHVTQTAGDGTQGTTDTYTMYADAAKTQVLGTFDVYNGYDGVASTVGSLVDVDLTTVPVKDGQTIVWNNVKGKWLPGDVSSSAIYTTYDNTTSKLTAIDVQSAIDEIENSVVKLTGNQTIAGIKTFSSNIVGNITGSITGNSATATKLQNARTINGVAFDGSANITVSDSTAVKLTGDQTIAGIKTFSSGIVGNITGNAATATTLSTNRNNYIGYTDSAVAGELMWKAYGNKHTIFDASNSTSPTGAGVNNTDPDTPWTPTRPTLMGYNGIQTYGVRVDSSRYADQLKTARTINGVAFDGTGNITISDNTKAPLASPALTGTPTAPTAPAGTNNTQIATTAFVQANKTEVNTTSVASATASIDVGVVGSYSFLSTGDGVSVALGGTKAGSGLRYAGVGQSGLVHGIAPTGTWRAMGSGSSTAGSVWLRIA